MSFDSGFNMGARIGQNRIDNERQAKLDARQDELNKRADERHNEEQAAWKAYRTDVPVAPVRVDPAQAAMPTGFQANTAGLVANPQGYRSQGTFGDGSDTGAIGLPPSMGGSVGTLNVQGLPQQDYVREKSQYDRDLNNRERALSLGLRDRAGVAAANAQEHVLNKQDIANDVMRMPTANLDKSVAGANISGLPIIYLGKGKNGYMVQTTDHDGEPGKKFTLTDAEARQLVMASKLGEAGYGSEALTVLAGAHKEIGAHVGTWNSTMLAAGKLSNDAVRQGNEDKNDAARTQALKGYYSTKEPKELAPEMVTKLNDLSAQITEAQTNGDTRLANTLTSEYGRVYGIAMSSLNKVVPPPRGKEPMSAKDEAETLVKLTEVYEDPGLARRHLDIQTGAASPQNIAATLRGDSPADQAAALAKWQMVSPAFAGKVAELLRGGSTQPAPTTRQGLPPPMVRPAAPASPTRTNAPPPATRGVPGQGQARLPWESPIGAY